MVDRNCPIHLLWQAIGFLFIRSARKIQWPIAVANQLVGNSGFQGVGRPRSAHREDLHRTTIRTNHSELVCAIPFSLANRLFTSSCLPLPIHKHMSSFWNRKRMSTLQADIPQVVTMVFQVPSCIAIDAIINSRHGCAHEQLSDFILLQGVFLGISRWGENHRKIDVAVFRTDYRLTQKDILLKTIRRLTSNLQGPPRSPDGTFDGL